MKETSDTGLNKYILDKKLGRRKFVKASTASAVLAGASTIVGCKSKKLPTREYEILVNKKDEKE